MKKKKKTFAPHKLKTLMYYSWVGPYHFSLDRHVYNIIFCFYYNSHVVFTCFFFTLESEKITTTWAYPLFPTMFALHNYSRLRLVKGTTQYQYTILISRNLRKIKHNNLRCFFVFSRKLIVILFSYTCLKFIRTE